MKQDDTQLERNNHLLIQIGRCAVVKKKAARAVSWLQTACIRKDAHDKELHDKEKSKLHLQAASHNCWED
jgi:hypothetical protein